MNNQQIDRTKFLSALIKYSDESGNFNPHFNKNEMMEILNITEGEFNFVQKSLGDKFCYYVGPHDGKDRYAINISECYKLKEMYDQEESRNKNSKSAALKTAYIGAGAVILAAIIAGVFGIFSSKKPTINIDNRGGTYIEKNSGNVSNEVVIKNEINLSNKNIINPKELELYTPSIDDDLKRPAALGLLEFDSKYKRALSYIKSKDFKSASDLFSIIYEVKPDYPTLANYYGQTLIKLGKYEEALPVLLSTPYLEKEPFVCFRIGIVSYYIGDYVLSKKYFDLAEKNLNRSNSRYWLSRAMLIYLETDVSNIDHLIDENKKFVEIINNDILDITKIDTIPNTNYEVDSQEIKNLVLMRKTSAFWLLYLSTNKLVNDSKKDYENALNLSIQAANILPLPVKGCLFNIENDKYLEFLNSLSNFYYNCTAIHPDASYPKFEAILEKLIDENACCNVDIADFATFLLAVYKGENNVNFTVNSTFKLTYKFYVRDDRELNLLSIRSPSFLYGNHDIDVKGKKEFLFEKEIVIESKSIKKVPYFTVTVSDWRNNTATFVKKPYIQIVIEK